MKKILATFLAVALLLSAVPHRGYGEAERETIEFFYSPWASSPYAGVDPL